MRTLREVMYPALSIGSCESLRQAAKLMAESSVPAICVTEDEVVVGLLSNRDLADRTVGGCLESDSTPVSQVMNANPAKVSDRRDVESTLLMAKVLGVHQLMVQDQAGEVVGIFCDCGCCHIAREYPCVLDRGRTTILGDGRH